ncbi:MAG: hypothetical protein FWD99_01380 [Oscillospiraceae bacterium]|nr:hypothetical protein [Oscillospiraceae bacterium]
MEKADLYQTLLAYQQRDICPMHMPGHKRQPLFAADLPWHLDISEIHGFDDLHSAEGILLDAQARAAALWGSDSAYFLVNGSTGGILAGIYAATRPGDQILIARNCHKSVYHAVELMGLCPVYLEPPLLTESGICGSIPLASVAVAVAQYPDIRLVVVTSPTYEGVASDIRAIADMLHEKSIPLLVDEAHGAHFGLSPHFPQSAVSQGADIVIRSLHKTLPSLTQTAIAHLRDGLIPREHLRHGLGLFQSTSPSYPLMASIDGCVDLLRVQGPDLFAAWSDRLSAFRQLTVNLQHLSVLSGDSDPRRIYAHDSGKLPILCGGTSTTGPELLMALREDCGIELEMALPGYALAMTGLANTDKHFYRLAEALVALDRTLHPTSIRPINPLPPMGKQIMPPGEALRTPGRRIAIGQSVGQIAKTYLWAYPPGIPLITPGQRITADLVDCLAGLSTRQIAVKSTAGCPAGWIEIAGEG